MAITVFAVAILLSWAWRLLRPLLPVIMGGVILVALVGGAVRTLVRRREYW
jgi:hypothetical protein